MGGALSLLHHFANSRETEQQNYGYIETIDNIDREARLLFNLVHEYYAQTDKDSASMDDLLTFYDINYPKAKNRELHVTLLQEAMSVDVNNELMSQVLDQYIEQHAATKIINKLVPVMEGEQYGILGDIRTDIDSYIDLLSNPPDKLVVPEPCDLSVSELVASEIEDEGLPWHLPELTKIVGGIRSKTLGLIYAYVDSGKTTFSLASAANFAKQLKEGEIICYAGNEEAAERLKLRGVQALINWTRTDIRNDPGRATELAEEAGLSRIKFFDQVSSGSQIEQIIRDYKPKILYVDQSTDVDVATVRKSDGVEYQKQLFKWYRRMANKWDCAIIGVSQGVGDAENKKFLKLSDIYGSRVAIQGALDYAIGIGRKTDDPTLEETRYIHVPKNKLHDGDGGRFTVHFDRIRARWEEI